MPRKPLFEAIATLVGMIIGAGILGIPFVVAKSGFLTGVIDIVVIGMAIVFMNLFIGEISLRTKRPHQLTGYAEKYIGKKGKIVMTILFVLGVYGAMSAYIIKIGEFLSEMISISFFSPLVCSIIFFVFGSVLVYLGLKAIEESELYMVFFILAIVVVLLIFSFSSIKIDNLTGFDYKKLFLPFGVVLFAYMGTAAIPEIREELRNNERLMKKAIIIGSVIPMVVYLLFAFIVVGVSGSLTTDGAIIGLKNFLGHWILLVGFIFGILTMSTSFLANGLALRDMYRFDFDFNKIKASLLTCLVPLFIAVGVILSGVSNGFYRVIDFTGAIVFPFTGIMVVLIYWKAKRKTERSPEFSLGRISWIVGIVLIIMFLLGFFYEIFKYMGSM